MYPCMWNLKSKAYKETGQKKSIKKNLLDIQQKIWFKCIKAIYKFRMNLGVHK